MKKVYKALQAATHGAGEEFLARYRQHKEGSTDMSAYDGTKVEVAPLAAPLDLPPTVVRGHNGNRIRAGASRPPDIWLVGRCRALEAQGLQPRDAVVQAVKDWQEQERFADQSGRIPIDA